MQLTEADNKAIQEGLEAQSLLETPYFVELMRSLCDECANDILRTDPLEKDLREAHYNRYLGLVSLTDTLKYRKDLKDSILESLEAAARAAQDTDPYESE